jgi:hypothetical protein
MGIDVTDGDVTVINSGISSDMFNIVCRARNKNALSSALQKFRDLKLPFACWIGFDDDYPECLRKLKIYLAKKSDELQISLVDDAKNIE